MVPKRETLVEEHSRQAWPHGVWPYRRNVFGNLVLRCAEEGKLGPSPRAEAGQELALQKAGSHENGWE